MNLAEWTNENDRSLRCVAAQDTGNEERLGNLSNGCSKNLGPNGAFNT
jgi:hypothetical protein